MIIQEQIKLDLDKRFQETPTANVIQSETARVLKFRLFNQGKEWTIPDSIRASIRFSIFDQGAVYGSTYDTLPDGSPAYAVENNTLTITLTPEILSVWGVGSLQIWLFDGHDVIATFHVRLRIQRNLAFEGITPQVRHDLSLQIQEEVTQQVEQYKPAPLPDYWANYLPEKIAAIKALQEAGGKDCFSFVVLTDVHYPQNLGKISPAIAKQIMDECNIKFALNLGDMMSRSTYSTVAQCEADFAGVKEMFAPIADRTLHTQGNHDGVYGIVGGKQLVLNYTPEKLYDRVYRSNGIVGDVHTDESGSGYYIDDTAAKVRYIILNTCCNDYEENADGTAKYGNIHIFRFTQSQFDMVKDALSSVPGDGWAVVVASHAPISNAYGDLFNGTYGTDAVDYAAMGDHVLMRGLLTAYKNKSTYTGTFSGTAEGGATYLNRADTSSADWVVDSRISSSGSIKSSTGAVVTNRITAKTGDIIRIKGLDLLSKLPDASNLPSIQGYDAAGTIVADSYFNTTSYANLFPVGADGVTTHVLYQSNGGSHKDSVTNIRICGTPIPGQEIIITVNEEIVVSSAYDASSVNVDFSDAKGQLVAFFSGHTHADRLWAADDGYGIHIITTRCDSQNENTTTLANERVTGTVTEQSFDVFTINKKTRTIHATKIGAGADRTIPY